MIKLENNITTKMHRQEIAIKYIIAGSICIALISISTFSQAADSSMDIVKNVMASITSLIKHEGKVGLQVLSAAAGGLAAAKTVSWQPLLVGAGGAGIVEVLFQAIA